MDEDELFDWLSETYSEQGDALPTIDLTEYQVSYTINKEPTGEETIHYKVYKDHGHEANGNQRRN